MSGYRKNSKGPCKPSVWGKAKDYCDTITAITEDEEVRNGCKSFQELGLLMLMVTEKL